MLEGERESGREGERGREAERQRGRERGGRERGETSLQHIQDFKRLGLRERD